MNRFRSTALFVCLVGILAASTAHADVKDFTARSATDYSLVRLSQHRGKVVLVNFWQSSCGWCKRQTPRLVELNRKYRSKGLVIISVSLEAERSADFRKKLPDYLRKHRMSWPQVMSGVGGLETHFGRRVSATPANFVISREGKEVYFGSGTGDDGWAKLEKAVASEIAKRVPAGQKIGRSNLKHAPRLGIPNRKGKVVTLKQFSGKPMIVHFFNFGNAHWLGKAMPDFHRKYAARGLQIVGVCLKKRDDFLSKYEQKYQPKYPILIGNKQTRRDWIGASKTWGLFFINARGQIVKQYKKSYSGMEKTEYPWFAEHLLSDDKTNRGPASTAKKDTAANRKNRLRRPGVSASTVDAKPSAKAALGTLRREAQKGDPWAMHFLGRLHYRAARGKRNKTLPRHFPEKARRYWQLQESALDAKGFQSNPKQAAKWVRAAVEKRLPAAMSLLGIFYQRGFGVKKDAKQAVKWYRRAAAKENTGGMLGLQQAYRTGVGVKKDEKQAFAWAQKAADLGHPRAMAILGSLHALGIGTSQDHAKAMEWWRKAADGNDRFGFRFLGLAYELSRGVKKDERQAVQWYRKGIAAGSTLCMVQLGIMHTQGRGGLRNKKAAFKLFQQAAAKGNVRGMANLGYAYATGKGVKTDDKQAVHWYRRAAKKGNSPSMYNLGFMYSLGRGVKQDDKQALAWYRKAADAGIPGAMYNVGYLYLHGRGVKKNRDEAIKWFRKAAKGGSKRAVTVLRQLGVSSKR